MKTLNPKSLLLLFAFCITLHNFEEWLTMEKWMRAHPDLLPRFILNMVQSNDFNALITISLILATVLTYAILLFAMNKKYVKPAGYVLLLLITLILINSVQHILTSLITREYNPGLVTAIFLNLPITLILLKQTVREKLIKTNDLLKRVFPVSLGLYVPVIILIWTLSFGIRLMLN